VKVYLDKSLHGQTDGFKACVADITDYTVGQLVYQPASFHLMHVTQLPYAFPNPYVAALVSEELYPQYFKKEYENMGVYLAHIDATLPADILSRKPIRRLEDLKGLKIRTTAGISTDILKALGAVPMVVQTAELYTAFQRGMIDGVAIGITDATPYRLQEVGKYCTLAKMYLSSNIFAFNKKTFDKLPPDLKRLLYNMFRFRNQMGERNFYAGENEGKAIEEMKKAGVEMITLPPEELKRWQKGNQHLWDKFVADNEALGLPAKKLVEDLVVRSAKYSTWTPDQIWEKVNKEPIPGIIDGM
jgi:TRAP-type transport system periplasmic protein